MVDLVNDVLRKRKTDYAVGWEPFARHLKRLNVPMELVGNADRQLYMQRVAAAKTSRRSTNRSSRAPRSQSLEAPHRWAKY